MVDLQEIEVLDQITNMKLEQGYPFLIAERTPTLKDLLVVLHNTFQRVSDISGGFFSNTVPKAYSDVCLQAFSLISLMIFMTTSPVITLHRSHYKGWKQLRGVVANCIISGNQLWCCQNCMIMIRPTLIFTSLPRTIFICSRVEKHTLGCLATPPSGHLFPILCHLRGLW